MLGLHKTWYSRMFNLGLFLLKDPRKGGVGVNKLGQEEAFTREERIRTGIDLLGFLLEEKGSKTHYRWQAKGFLLYALETDNPLRQQEAYGSAQHLLAFMKNEGIAHDKDTKLHDLVSESFRRDVFSIPREVILTSDSPQTWRGDVQAEKVEVLANELERAIGKQAISGLRTNSRDEGFLYQKIDHVDLILQLRTIAVQERGNEHDYLHLGKAYVQVAECSEGRASRHYMRRAMRCFEIASLSDALDAYESLSGAEYSLAQELDDTNLFRRAAKHQELVADNSNYPGTHYFRLAEIYFNWGVSLDEDEPIDQFDTTTDPKKLFGACIDAVNKAMGGGTADTYLRLRGLAYWRLASLSILPDEATTHLRLAKSDFEGSLALSQKEDVQDYLEDVRKELAGRYL